MRMYANVSECELAGSEQCTASSVNACARSAVAPGQFGER